MTFGTILTIAFAVYILFSAVLVLLDNRSPQSTLAWLLLFFAFPLIGLLVYIFLGRTWKAFSKQGDRMRQEIGEDFGRVLKPLLDRQEEYVEKIATDKPESYKKRLLHLVQSNAASFVTGYNEVEILQNASDKYPRLLEDIANAQHFIHMEYYIWTDDSFTQQVKEALCAKAKEGVEVRCLFDASGGKLGETYLKDLREAGAQIHPYLEFRALNKLHNANYRSHRKVVIIDSQIGYVGGLNLDKDQLDGGEYFDAWRDTHLRVRGEAAVVLNVGFVGGWYATTKENLCQPKYFPPTTEVENFLPVQITMAGPDSEWGAIRQLYFLMLLSAEDKIYLQSPFFIPDESIAEALKAAALSGVEVTMMFTPRGTAYSLPYWAANTYFADMARAGIRIYHYQAGYFHPKTLNIDSAICTVGTANMDIRSFSLNYEVNAVIYDQEKAQELAHTFHHDLEFCEEWTLEAYQKQSIFLRLRDSVARLASPLL